MNSPHQVPLYERGYEKDPAKVCGVCVWRNGEVLGGLCLVLVPDAAAPVTRFHALLPRSVDSIASAVGLPGPPACPRSHPASTAPPPTCPLCRSRLRGTRRRSGAALTCCWWTRRGACRCEGGVWCVGGVGGGAGQGTGDEGVGYVERQVCWGSWEFWWERGRGRCMLPVAQLTVPTALGIIPVGGCRCRHAPTTRPPARPTRRRTTSR